MLYRVNSIVVCIAGESSEPAASDAELLVLPAGVDEEPGSLRSSNRKVCIISKLSLEPYDRAMSPGMYNL